MTDEQVGAAWDRAMAANWHRSWLEFCSVAPWLILVLGCGVIWYLFTEVYKDELYLLGLDIKEFMHYRKARQDIQYILLDAEQEIEYLTEVYNRPAWSEVDGD